MFVKDNIFREYNLINNIPIIYPNLNENILNISLYPRWNIATADKINKIFNKNNKKNISIDDKDYMYIKVRINKKFKSLNDDIIALYYYILLDIYDDKSFDNNNFSIEKNNYILITTPLLKYKDILYNIANDEKVSIVRHDNNKTYDILSKILLNKCYTVCDNYNIIIALYQQKIIKIKEFLTLIKDINKKKKEYVTTSKWLEHIYNHRMINACDFPYMQLMVTPNLINNKIEKDLRVINFLNKYTYNITIYNNNILFSSNFSCSYPNILMNDMNNINPLKNSWKNYNPYNNIHREKYEIYLNDFYGLFASICCKKRKLWYYWDKNKNSICEIFIENYNNNKELLLINILYNLFRLYEVGFEDVIIKYSKIRYIWEYVLFKLNIGDANLENIVNKLLLNSNSKIPYIFFKYLYEIYDLNFGKKKLYLIKSNNTFIYKKISLYNIIYVNNNINVKYFESRIQLILLCIYKKFGLFKNEKKVKYNNVGNLLIEYISNNINLII